jgi:hypothetical protein
VNFIFTLMYTWYLCSRRHTSDFHALTIDTSESVPLRYQGLYTGAGYTVSSVCSQQVTACFTSASVANRLPTRCFLRGLQRYKSLGPIMPKKLVTFYGAMIGNRRRKEASCYLLVTGIWHRFFLRRDISLDTTVGRMLACQL